MTKTLSLSKTGLIHASTLGSLEDYCNRKFIRERNGAVTTVVLEKVKRQTVKLTHTDGRADGLTISHVEFRKFFELIPET